jgi:hypothetical protein
MQLEDILQYMETAVSRSYPFHRVLVFVATIGIFTTACDALVDSSTSRTPKPALPLNTDGMDIDDGRLVSHDYRRLSHTAENNRGKIDQQNCEVIQAYL